MINHHSDHSDRQEDCQTTPPGASSFPASGVYVVDPAGVGPATLEPGDLIRLNGLLADEMARAGIDSDELVVLVTADFQRWADASERGEWMAPALLGSLSDAPEPLQAPVMRAWVRWAEMLRQRAAEALVATVPDDDLPEVDDRPALVAALLAGEVEDLYWPLGAEHANVTIPRLPPYVDPRLPVAQWAAIHRAGHDPSAVMLVAFTRRVAAALAARSTSPFSAFASDVPDALLDGSAANVAGAQTIQTIKGGR